MFFKRWKQQKAKRWDREDDSMIKITGSRKCGLTLHFRSERKTHSQGQNGQQKLTFHFTVDL